MNDSLLSGELQQPISLMN